MHSVPISDLDSVNNDNEHHDIVIALCCAMPQQTVDQCGGLFITISHQIQSSTSHVCLVSVEHTLKINKGAKLLK